MSKITLTCEKCGKPFERERGEHNRNIKKGRRPYCSLSCAGDLNKIPIEKRLRPENVAGKQFNRQDEFSPFRWHLRNVRRRDKEYNITLQDLKEQWDKQGGVCPYTGWKLVQCANTSMSEQLPLTPERASLDRIDSSKGYIRGNIRFVSFMAQCAKHVFADDDVRRFVEAAAARQLCA